MDDSDDFYDGLAEGLFWFFWPKGLWQWLLYFALVVGIALAKEHHHQEVAAQKAAPAAASPAPTAPKL